MISKHDKLRLALNLCFRCASIGSEPELNSRGAPHAKAVRLGLGSVHAEGGWFWR